MRNTSKFLATALLAASAVIGSSAASAFWGPFDWFDGPGWGGYPGYGYGGPWGGYPGYGYGGPWGGGPGYGWGGYPGYGYPGYGWGGYPDYGAPYGMPGYVPPAQPATPKSE